MTNNVYSLLNTLSGRFGDVVAYPTDAFARARTIDIMRKCKLSTTEYQLWKIGSIDVESGQLTVVKPVIITGLVDEYGEEDDQI